MTYSPLDNVSEMLSVWPSKGLKSKKLGLLGKKGGKGSEFCPYKLQTEILIGWELLYVDQMSWLSLKGTIDWEIEREKQYFQVI